MEQPIQLRSAETSLLQPTTPPPLYYSHSALKTQAICPARHFFRKEVKAGRITQDSNLPMVFGSAVHKGIEERLKYERNPTVVAQLYLEENLSAFTKGKDYSVKEYDEKQFLLHTCINNFEEHFYHDLKEALVDPINQVELKLETPFRKGYLVGVVDIGMAGIFADWKTGRVPTASALKMDPQAGFYWYLAQQNGLEPPKEFVYVFLTGKNM